MSHASAAALLDRVHHSADPRVVERVLTLVDREGVDMIAELWSRSEPDSLPGIMWRLYTLRSWMRRDRDLISRLWRLGEPVATAASAIAGVDQAPTEADIAHTAIRFSQARSPAILRLRWNVRPRSPTWLRWDCASRHAI